MRGGQRGRCAGARGAYDGGVVAEHVLAELQQLGCYPDTGGEGAVDGRELGEGFGDADLFAGSDEAEAVVSGEAVDGQ